MKRMTQIEEAKRELRMMKMDTEILAIQELINKNYELAIPEKYTQIGSYLIPIYSVEFMNNINKLQKLIQELIQIKYPLLLKHYKLIENEQVN